MVQPTTNKCGAELEPGGGQSEQNGGADVMGLVQSVASVDINETDLRADLGIHIICSVVPQHYEAPSHVTSAPQVMALGRQSIGSRRDRIRGVNVYF